MVAVADIKLYTKENCPLCEEVKELLKANDISYIELVIGKDVTRDEVLKRYPNVKVAPVIVYTQETVLSKEVLSTIINHKKGKIDA